MSDQVSGADEGAVASNDETNSARKVIDRAKLAAQLRKETDAKLAARVNCSTCAGKGTRDENGCPACGTKKRGRKPGQVARELKDKANEGFLFGDAASGEAKAAPVSDLRSDGPPIEATRTKKKVRFSGKTFAPLAVAAIDAGDEALTEMIVSGLEKPWPEQILASTKEVYDRPMAKKLKKAFDECVVMMVEDWGIEMEPWQAVALLAVPLYGAKYAILAKAVHEIKQEARKRGPRPVPNPVPKAE